MLRTCLLICVQALLHTSVFLSFASGADEINLSRVLKAPGSRVVPGSIAVVSTNVSNLGDVAWEGVIIAKLVGQAAADTARQVRLEPRAARLFEIPVQLPLALQSAPNVEIEVTLRSSNERIVERRGQPLREVVKLRIDPPQTWAASGFDAPPPDYPAWFWPPPSKEHSSYEFAVAVQVDEEEPRDFIGYETYGFPGRLEELSHIDLVVVSDPDLLADSTALETLRQYVQDGGRAWVMLDKLPTESVRPLFEDHQTCIEVGSTSLSEFVVDPVANSILSEDDRRATLRKPATFKRVVVTGGNVLQSIEGWPAALEFSIGYGQLYLTTLSDYGWLELRETQKSDPSRQSKYTMRRWAQPVSASLAGISRAQRPLNNSLDYPLELLGVPVFPRAGVGVFLGGFCVLLTGIGAWFWMRGDLVWVGAAVPLTAISVALVIICAKSWMSADVEETLARVQVIEVASDGLRAQVKEQAAVLLKGVDSLSVESVSDGRANVVSDADNGLFRYSITGFETWKFENENWPTGTTRYVSAYGVDLNEPLYATAKLSEAGCEIELPTRLIERFEDAILAFQPATPMFCASSGTGLASNGEVKAGEGRWIQGTFMSDEQRRRSSILQSYFGDVETKSRPPRMLYGWTDLWPEAELNREIASKGSALMAIPVKLQRPSAEQAVFVPHGFLKLIQSSLKAGSTAAYEDASGRWRGEQTQAIDRPFEFVMPRELLPFRATEISLDLDINAPQRTVVVSAVTDTGEKIVLEELDSPSLPWSAKIRDPGVLKSISDGTLQVWLRVSERKNPSSANVVAWNVDSFHANVRGSVQQP
ncbi:MAG: hypothetical protein AB8B50_09450 [Pirellulaceae bacterium]